MVSILKVMEASLELRPELALDADLRDEKLEVFLEVSPADPSLPSRSPLP